MPPFQVAKSRITSSCFQRLGDSVSVEWHRRSTIWTRRTGAVRASCRPKKKQRRSGGEAKQRGDEPQMLRANLDVARHESTESDEYNRRNAVSEQTAPRRQQVGRDPEQEDPEAGDEATPRAEHDP